MVTVMNRAAFSARLFFTLVIVAAMGLPCPVARAADQGRKVQPAALTKADFDKHVEQLKKKVPSKDFTVIVTPPFVVIGDEAPEQVRSRSENTVKWAVEKLKKAYFQQDPQQILDIWLFKDKASYESELQAAFRQDARHALRLFLAARRGPGNEHLDGRGHAGA